MAARENQGLQIALIIFVMLTIVLIVTTYMFFRSYSDERDRAKSLGEQKTSADQATTAAIEDSENLKTVIGAAQTESISAIKEAATKQLDTLGNGLVDTQKNFRGLVQRLTDELRKSETANTELAAKVAELNAQLKTNDEAAKGEVAKLTEQLESIVNDLKKERVAFGDQRTEITGQKDQLAASFETTQKAYDKLSQESTEKVTSLTATLTRAERLLDALRNKEQLDLKANEVADGRLTRVNQRTRLAWINVGPADGLRRQTSFVVVAPEDGNPIKSKPKGILEVVRLTSAHEAECRIVEDDLSNPMMPGDNIFSVAWEAGRTEHFALAGQMDIDDDGESDRERIRDLISLNGGSVDAEVADDGQRTGQMSINTKYLVLGDTPDADSKDREAYGAILAEARSLGVNIINVHEFVDYLGYRDEHRTVNLGRYAKPSDFKPRLPNDTQRIVPGSAPAKDLRKPRDASQAAPY